MERKSLDQVFEELWNKELINCDSKEDVENSAPSGIGFADNLKDFAKEMFKAGWREGFKDGTATVYNQFAQRTGEHLGKYF